MIFFFLHWKCTVGQWAKQGRSVKLHSSVVTSILFAIKQSGAFTTQRGNPLIVFSWRFHCYRDNTLNYSHRHLTALLTIKIIEATIKIPQIIDPMYTLGLFSFIVLKYVSYFQFGMLLLASFFIGEHFQKCTHIFKYIFYFTISQASQCTVLVQAIFATHRTMQRIEGLKWLDMGGQLPGVTELYRQQCCQVGF